MQTEHISADADFLLAWDYLRASRRQANKAREEECFDTHTILLGMAQESWERANALCIAGANRRIFEFLTEDDGDIAADLGAMSRPPAQSKRA